MIRLQESKALQRKIRQDDPAELGIPTWTLIREAIQAGRTDEALDFIDYACAEATINNNSLAALGGALITYIASFGEEEVEKIYRQRYTPLAKDWLTISSVLERLQRSVEWQRSHISNITVTDEPDRYMMRCDPCGTGGRLRRAGTVGVTKKAYPWSWGKSGVSYYCTHCCLLWEVIPIELCGYPLAINLLGDTPEEPCVRLFYKKPELIPEEYFTRVGKTKPIK